MIGQYASALERRYNSSNVQHLFLFFTYFFLTSTDKVKSMLLNKFYKISDL